VKRQGTIPRILEYVKPYKKWLGIAMFCMVIVAAMGGAQAYMVKPLLDEIFFKQDHTMLLFVPLLILAIFLVKGLFYYSYNYLLEKVGQSVIRDLRNKLYSHIQSLPLSFFNKKPTGELISRIISQTSQQKQPADNSAGFKHSLRDNYGQPYCKGFLHGTI
jgi:subfamily B ATP-binding cassette protein MsbA